MAGADSALAHAEMRLADPGRHPPLGPDVPFALHSCLEAPLADLGRPAPGVIRTTDDLVLPLSRTPPPPWTDCAELVDEALSVANQSELPPIVKGAWILYTLGAIHPFADGNGRVARLLYLLTAAGNGGPGELDLGVNEQIRFHAEHWVKSQVATEAGPTVQVVAELSIAGATLWTHRAEAASALATWMSSRFGMSAPLAALTTAVWIRRGAGVDELSTDTGQEQETCIRQTDELVSAGVLDRRTAAPPSSGQGPSFALTTQVVAELSSL